MMPCHISAACRAVTASLISNVGCRLTLPGFCPFTKRLGNATQVEIDFPRSN